MKYFLLITTVALAIIGCEGMRPKGINLGIDFTSEPSPTSKQASNWRKSQRWRSVGKGKWKNEAQPNQPVLINGNPVDKAKYPTVVRITSASGAGCTANIVGPSAIITAAHCADTGEKVTFKTYDGRAYSAVMTHYEKYPDDDLDLNIGKVNTPIVGIKPMTIRTDRFEKKDMLVDLIGYGCINPGGGGGNDGILRMGSAKVTAGQGYDLALDASPSALCYGDSGGPVFYQGQQIGVNSKGNIQDKSFTTRTTLPESKAWLEKTASALGLEICGINSKCDGATPPPQNPKEFSFENDVVKITGTVK